jgi:hypothetical protein
MEMGLDQRQLAFVEIARRQKWPFERVLKLVGNTIDPGLLKAALEEKRAAPEKPKQSLWNRMSFEEKSLSILEGIRDGKTSREMAAELGTPASSVWNFCQKKRATGDMRFVLPGTSQLGGKIAAAQNPNWGSVGSYRK